MIQELKPKFSCIQSLRSFPTPWFLKDDNYVYVFQSLLLKWCSLLLVRLWNNHLRAYDVFGPTISLSAYLNYIVTTSVMHHALFFRFYSVKALQTEMTGLCFGSVASAYFKHWNIQSDNKHHIGWLSEVTLELNEKPEGRRFLLFIYRQKMLPGGNCVYSLLVLKCVV